MSENEIKRPDFAQKIIENYVSAQSNAFLIHGNIRDIYPVSEDEYVPLTDFLIRALIRPDKADWPRIVIVYDPAAGISFVDPADEDLVASEVGQNRLKSILTAARKDIVLGCAGLREITRANVTVDVDGNGTSRIRKDFAIIIRHGEAVAPSSRAGYTLHEELLKSLTLENWFSDSTFVASSDIVFLIAETASSVNERIVELPYLSAIRIARPNEDQRKLFVEKLVEEEEVKISVGAQHIAYNSAGLTLLAIQQIFRRASYRSETITPVLLFEKTKEIIEKELEGLVEFPRLEHDFTDVIGAARLLKKLRELKQCLASGDPELMPVGILVPGANGVGKTFIYKAFAKECQWVAVVIKNIRGQYVGQTEKNWERIRSVLEAMTSVMVIYDEADTEIGGRSAQTHDVDRRLFGNILRMMSDSSNRGKIVWIIITARPDRLEPDIKRSGRAGEHLPVFDNEGEEKEAFLKHVLRIAGMDPDKFSPTQMAAFVEATTDYYPADFDQLLTELKRRQFADSELTPESVLEEVKDFIPSDLAKQREFQELLAVLECTSKEILPDRYAHVSREAVEQRLQAIKAGTVF